MRYFLIAVLVLAAALLLRAPLRARLETFRANRARRAAQGGAASGNRQESVRVVPTPPPPAVPMPTMPAPPMPVQSRPVPPISAAPAVAVPTRPPGTAHLDDPDAVRPDVDHAALHQARATVVDFVPDAVLQDALLDATPQDLSRLLAEVPEDVLARAVGAPETTQSTPLKAEEAQQIAAVAEGLDDLDIWNFGGDGAKA